MFLTCVHLLEFNFQKKMLVVFYCLLHPGVFNVEAVVGVVLYDVLDFVLSHSKFR